MSSNSIVPKIVMINVLVYFLWNFYGSLNPEFMIQNFLVSWSAIAEGRLWTLVTSMFSHNMLWHILINMLVFFNFGIIVENYLGTRRFLAFYLIAGIAGSLAHSMVSSFLLSEPRLPALGASGAIAGVVLLFALVYPKERIYLFGIIPMPAIWAALLFVGLDAYGLFTQTRGSTSPIGFGAHLGGAIVGMLYFGMLKIQSTRPRYP